MNTMLPQWGPTRTNNIWKFHLHVDAMDINPGLSLRVDRYVQAKVRYRSGFANSAVLFNDSVGSSLTSRALDALAKNKDIKKVLSAGTYTVSTNNVGSLTSQMAAILVAASAACGSEENNNYRDVLGSTTSVLDSRNCLNGGSDLSLLQLPRLRLLLCEHPNGSVLGPKKLLPFTTENFSTEEAFAAFLQNQTTSSINEESPLTLVKQAALEVQENVKSYAVIGQGGVYDPVAVLLPADSRYLGSQKLLLAAVARRLNPPANQSGVWNLSLILTAPNRAR